MQPEIRPYHPSDLTSLYRICLQTGDSGKDASMKYKDPDLLGQFYAAPYAVLEPELCFVLTCTGRPCGYIIGTGDSQNFYERCEREWFPVLRERYPMPADEDTSADAHIIRLIHKGHVPNPDLSDYPAHLHIDILPEGQGKGMGRKLIETLISALRVRGVPALHLQVGKANANAVQFYQRVGFQVIKEYERAVAFGIKL
jgi:ribosomal protein S18 acetylase RimI-like enzyme